jgi:hypothetical protein
VPNSRAEYYRRQAEICVRLAANESHVPLCAGLISLAQRYKAKAEVAEGEHHPRRGAQTTARGYRDHG